jgi:hypothetical protein
VGIGANRNDHRISVGVGHRLPRDDGGAELSGNGVCSLVIPIGDGEFADPWVCDEVFDPD